MTLTESRPYVEERNGGLYIAGTRVSLDSVVYAYRQGFSPEQIIDSYPALTLEQIHGGIAFYLANQNAVDTYIQEKAEKFEAERQRQWAANPEMHARLLAARDRLRRNEKDAA